jgi:hypothetical protein
LFASSIAGGGKLIVTNSGPDIINGTTFTLFSGPATGFQSISLPAKDPSGTKTYTWVTNIAVNGSITLQSGGATAPTGPPIAVSYSSAGGGTLTMAWPSANIGWIMYSNSVGLLNTNLWFPIAGSSTTNRITAPVDASKGNVFFRLRSP